MASITAELEEPSEDSLQESEDNTDPIHTVSRKIDTTSFAFTLTRQKRTENMYTQIIALVGRIAHAIPANMVLHLSLDLQGFVRCTRRQSRAAERTSQARRTQLGHPTGNILRL